MLLGDDIMEILPVQVLKTSRVIAETKVYCMLELCKKVEVSNKIKKGRDFTVDGVRMRL